jgi:D-xylose transport system substrate-binding protein
MFDRRRRWLIVASIAMIALVGSACSKKTAGGGSTTALKIALLLPETKTARYETQDRPLFEKKVKALCSSCEILYSNANEDAPTQQSQADAALTNGANVLVLDPVDGAAAASIVTKAKAQNVPVVSYDRLILNSDPDVYISFDNAKVGQLQGQALVDKLKADGHTSGNIVMINGDPADNNAKLFKQGAHSVLDSSGFTVAKEYDTPGWGPDKAQQEMDQAITALGKTGFVGVYAANDGTGGGAIAAMKTAGIDPKTIPVTGQDAELAAIQRILVDEQYMTVYKAIKPEAEEAAEIAVALAKGQAIPSGMQTGTVNNGQKDVPSVLLTPVEVTKDKNKDTIIKDAFWTAAQICTADFASACTAAGIS